MDGQEFDKIAKKLTSFASRRQALGGLLGAAAAVAGFGAVADAKKNGKGKGKKGGISKGKGIGKAQCGTTGCIACSFGNGPATPAGQCPNVGGFGGGVPVCATGISYTTCGSGGGLNICADCGDGNFDVCAPNTEGNGGTCVDIPPCGFTLADNQCVAATGGNAFCTTADGGNGFCGRNPNQGFTCLPGCGANQTCTAGGPFDFTCFNGPCSQYCPNGCCAGPGDPIFQVGSCQPGNDILACGSAGGTCTSCLLTCGLNGSCVNGECSCLTTTTTTTATPPQCNGCLNANGGCAPGTRRGACGVGGAACRRCSGKRKKCRNGRCVK